MEFELLRSHLHKYGVTLNFVNRRLFAKLATVLSDETVIEAVIEGSEQITNNRVSFVLLDDQIVSLTYLGGVGVDLAVIKIPDIVDVSVINDGTSVVTIDTAFRRHVIERVPPAMAATFSGMLQ